jgi:hypothetical protein
MAIWLGILLIVLLVGVVLFMGQRRTEGFGEQLDFGNRQDTYFHDQINKGILTNPGLNLSGLNEAVAQPDLYLAESPAEDMTRFFVEDPENAFTEADFEMCRGAAHPLNLPARAPRDLIGCGWYFKESPDEMSVGALGRRKGPILANSLTGGRWIWNRAQAAKLEDKKRCKMFKNCELLAFGDISSQCGFCPEKGHGIPIFSNGTPKYPEDADAVCGTKVITRIEGCAAQQTDGGGDVLSTGGPVEGAVGSNPCLNNGIVTIECALTHIQSLGFNTITGGLAKLISNGSMNQMTTSALQKLSESELSIPEAYWKKRSFQVINNNIPLMKNIVTLAKRRSKQDDSRAALYLLDGTPYTPCESYKPEQVGPFNTECLQQAFRKTGCQAGGAAYPNARTAVSDLANLTWSQVNAKFKQTYDEMKSADPRTQDMALKNCLGVGSEFARDKGVTCWKCEDGIHVPLRRNAEGDIECAATNGRNCLWQANKAGCDALIARLPSLDLKPLACGADHKAVWGGDGYSTPAHWCAKAAAGGKHNGPLAK